MPRRMKRNDIDVILYGDAAPPFTVADPPGTMALNERTGVLYIRRQDMTAIPISVAGGVKVDDPGDGKAIPIERSAHVALVTGGAETRTLADPARPGLTLDLYFKTDGGDCVVTAASPINQNGVTVMTFSSVGDHIRLVSVEDGADFEWRVEDSSGVVPSSVLFADGSAGAPSISFAASGQQDVGIFRAGSDLMGFTVAGISRVQMRANGLEIVDGYSLIDGNGNQIIIPVGVAAAINEFTIRNAASGNSPIIEATGGNTDIDITLTPKGAGAVTLGGHAAIGTGAPRVRMVKLTGTSAPDGSSVTIAHGLSDRTKIIGAQVLVSNDTGNRIPPNFTSVGNHEFDFFIDTTNVIVYCISANSSSINGNAVTVLITYEE